MKLLCIKSRLAHWGTILTEGNEYEVVEEYQKSVEVITNYDEWYKQLGLASGSITWIRKGYTEDNLHEVIPGYMSMSEMNRLYTKRVLMPHFDIRTDEGKTMTFCILSEDEILSLGADVSKAPNRKKNGRPAFGYSVNLIDEYFNYQPIRRDNKLNNILGE